MSATFQASDTSGSYEFWLPPLPVAQATMWQLISSSGSAPSGLDSPVAAWSDAANGMYVHGFDGSSAGAREVRPLWNGRFEAQMTSCGLPRPEHLAQAFSTS